MRHADNEYRAIVHSCNHLSEVMDASPTPRLGLIS